jgi:hypothetical protein
VKELHLYDLSSVIYQRDDALEKLKIAYEEI